MQAYMHTLIVLRETRRCMVTETILSAMSEYTSIRVTTELADELYERKSRGESYEDVIWRLLEEENEE
jgi:hypothetical protein